MPLGLQSNGTINFTAAQLDGICLPKVWLAIHALTTAGEHIVWGAGWVMVKRAGVGPTIRIPLSPVPTIIPAGCIYEIPAGVTITFPKAPAIYGTIICDPPSGELPQGSWSVTAY